MARYRKIDVRMWGDDKFRRLSPLQPSGQALWIYLLTNPDTVNIPGLYRAGEAGLSEALGWPLKAFREAFREASREGMVKADWSARVVWVPKGIVYNAPESWNVVKSWRSAWDEIPECPLKIQAYQHLKAFLEAKSEAFAKAFLEACTKPVDRRLVEPSPNQEQEQEQEQEQKKDGVSSLRSDPTPKALQTQKPLTEVQKVVTVFKIVSGYERDDPAWDKAHFPRCAKSAKALIDFMGNWKDAADCVQDVYEKLTGKGLTVTLETVLKHSADWKKDKREMEAKPRGILPVSSNGSLPTLRVGVGEASEPRKEITHSRGLRPENSDGESHHSEGQAVPDAPRDSRSPQTSNA